MKKIGKYIYASDLNQLVHQHRSQWTTDLNTLLNITFTLAPPYSLRGNTGDNEEVLLWTSKDPKDPHIKITLEIQGDSIHQFDYQIVWENYSHNKRHIIADQSNQSLSELKSIFKVPATQRLLFHYLQSYHS